MGGLCQGKLRHLGNLVLPLPCGASAVIGQVASCLKIKSERGVIVNGNI